MPRPRPGVSVIIPAYNAAHTVGVAINSVLAQTYTDFELLIVDDGSLDDTPRTVASWTDPRVRCVTVTNGGVSRARNHGVRLTSGDLVAFLDADDLWHPTKLERQAMAMAMRPRVGLCFTTAERVDDRLRKLGEEPAVQYRDFTQALLTIGNVITGSSSGVMVKRGVIEAAGGFDPLLSQCADWDLWLRLSRSTEFVALPEPLVQYRKAPGTMSGDPVLLERDTFALLNKFFQSREAPAYEHVRRAAYGNQWMVCSGTYLHAGRLRDALRCMARATIEDPRTLKRPLLLPVRAASRAHGHETKSAARRHSEL